ncbi:oligosaccharide flippase family protein [Aldersonia kunmingensis]|uniref:oligosaccharide flippase family protein n=1 Tax=Aldersonia kunmingensis TaxID=408066 RepID=UPI000B088094|nr:oligosaccharide flippase family protein [Aldersonia kunmingensis]
MNTPPNASTKAGVTAADGVDAAHAAEFDPTAAIGVDPHAGLTSKIGRVASASAVALIFGELITFVQTVALARLLSPAEVGLFVAGTVLVTFLGNFVEGGLRSGLIHREDRLDDAAETVFYVTAVGGLLMALLTLACAPLIGLIFHDREIGLITAASAGVLFLYSFTNVPEALLQREFNVRRRLIVGPAVSVSFAVTAVTLAANGFGVWSQVAGLYASYVVWVIAVWCISDWRPGRGRFRFDLWRELARYGFPLVLGALGARLQNLGEAVVLGRGLSSAALGHFRYAQRIAQIPVRAIIEIGAIALFPAFSRISSDRDRMRVAYLSATRVGVIGAAAVSGLMLSLGVPSVVVMFGEPWREAGLLVAAMAGLGVGKAITSVSEESIKGGGRTSLLNWYTAVEVTLGIGLLIVLTSLFGLLGAGLSISVTALLVALTCVVLAKPVVGFSAREFMVAISPPLPAATVATVITACLEHFVLHADAHSTLVGVCFLVLDTIVFLLVYGVVLAAILPSPARAAVKAAQGLLVSRGRSA